VKGLSTQGPHQLTLQRMFVDPTLVSQSLSLQAERHTVGDYLRADIVGRHHFLILGAPGSGKTTLLRHIAFTLAAQRRPRQQENAQQRLPILLFLPDYADKIKNNPNLTLAEAVRVRVLLVERVIASPDPGGYGSVLRSADAP